MYGCESWTIKKAEHWRIDAFESWCWRRLLRVPCTARRSNQSILKEITPEHSLEGLILKLKLRYFGCLMCVKNWLIGKDPDAGKGWGQEEKGTTENLHHWFDGQELSKLRELVMDREAWHAAVPGIAKSWIGLSGWTELLLKVSYIALTIVILVIICLIFASLIKLKWKIQKGRTMSTLVPYFFLSLV